MEIQVQEKDGNLFCLKHQEKITMFIMDSQVPFQDTLLCSQCLDERNMVCNKLISLSKAEQMIQEQNVDYNQNKSSQKDSLVTNLNIFSNKLIDYRNRINQEIDTILNLISQWIKDLNGLKNQYVMKSLLQQLKQLHQVNKDNKIEVQTLDEIKNAHSSKLVNHFQKLYVLDDLNKCGQHLKQILNQEQNEQNTQINRNQVANIHNKPNIKIQEQVVANIPKKCYQINNQKQVEWCQAIAFNKTGSIMVIGCKCVIKLWKLDKRKLTELKNITGHADYIICLVFSKYLNWFVSGSDDCTIRCWKEQQNKWISTQSYKYHSFSVQCLLLNSKENELISGSKDNTIKVWYVDCSNNQIKFNYKLDNKHKNSVYSVSLNQNESALVSCSFDETIILWMKGYNNKWEYINHIEGQFGSRVCFVSDTQFLFQPCLVNKTKIFNIENKQIIEQQNLEINLKDAISDCSLFPTLYNKKRQLIIQKHNKYVYLIQKQTDGTFKIVLEPIDCKSSLNFGTLNEDGEYLAIWDDETKEVKVYQIYY